MSSAKLAILEIAFYAMTDSIRYMTSVREWIDASLKGMGRGAPKALAELLDVKPDVISKLRSGVRQPRADEIPILEDFFGTKAPYKTLSPSIQPYNSPQARKSNGDVWVFPPSFIRESAISPTTRFVTFDVGHAKVEVTIIGRSIEGVTPHGPRTHGRIHSRSSESVARIQPKNRGT
jgi:hypothetical protein